ncbi:TetR/AcrR family transcriptional regulator [Vallitalea maricola]|uniref:TetR/AcrR family transcriptional regulator n=1 Tax=Vallitalea maricola TaxID=3074433 RepID=A0ACB5UNX5_9FIRM|nr:TetR/AcrR family transcriptional regulator [Vallitalea sp. AN17-2]
MPRAFSEEELKTIKAQLLQKGKMLFERYGYKKFGIRDLTSEVGIANGMFYKFFESKEKLFFEIINIEKKKLRKKILSEVMINKDNPIKALKNFYYVIVKELYENSLMNTILLKKEYDFITENMSSNELINEREKSLDPILELVDYWKSENLIKDVDTDIIIGAVRSLVYLNFHKEEIGIDKYDQIVEFLLDRICEYVNVEG